MTRPTDLQVIVQSFVSQIVAAVDAATTQRIHGALAQAIGSPLRRGQGRLRKGPLAPAAKAGKAPPSAALATPKRRARVSAKQERARRIQGQYLGTMRTLSAESRSRVKVATSWCGRP